MKARIIYCHGFGSVGDTPKSRKLAKTFKDHEVLAPDIPADPRQAVRTIRQLVSHAADYLPTIFVGTSVGGFYANYFAQCFDQPCILVNPSLTPSIALAKYVGQPFYNFKTNEPIHITAQWLEDFAQMEKVTQEDYNQSLVHLFVAKDDDIVDYETTLKLVPSAASTTITDDGGHRYDNKWNLVIDKIQALLNNLNDYENSIAELNQTDSVDNQD